MSEPFNIMASSAVILGEEQAKHFTLSIFADVKAYIKEHHAEFDAWQRGQIDHIGECEGGTSLDF